MNKYQEALDEIGDDLKFLGEGGVLEMTIWADLQELVNKETPKDYYLDENKEECCPSCRKKLPLVPMHYCCFCGQKIGGWKN